MRDNEERLSQPFFVLFLALRGYVGYHVRCYSRILAWQGSVGIKNSQQCQSLLTRLISCEEARSANVTWP